MHVSFGALRTDHADILALVDAQPETFDFSAFCRVVARQLGRKLVLLPFDPAEVDDDAQAELPAGPYSSGCSPYTGFYTRVEDPRRPGVIRDVIGYGSNPSIPRSVQERFMAHELGHMVMHHANQSDREAEQDRLARVFAPTLYEFGGREGIRQIMGRSGVRTQEEEQAEGFAVLLQERIAARAGQASAGEGLVSRIALPLLDPFRRRGGA